MEINFRVGEREQHDVYFSWNQMTGGLRIAVDGVDVLKTLRVLSFSLVKTYEFPVGVEERHVVRFDITRTLFFSGFRPQKVTVILDGYVVDERMSNISDPTPQVGPGAPPH